MDDDLIPLKRVASRLGVSRATLWRVSRGAPFPASVKMLGRIYWRARDISEMEAALDAFQGRSAFERERRRAKACQAATRAMAANTKKPKRVRAGPDGLAQPDLFGGPLASAPGGAERLK
jgi:predicted DNA-binding transcriptional regulator AlpA